MLNQLARCKQKGHTNCKNVVYPRRGEHDHLELKRAQTRWLATECDASTHKRLSTEMKVKCGMKPKGAKMIIVVTRQLGITLIYGSFERSLCIDKLCSFMVTILLRLELPTKAVM